MATITTDTYLDSGTARTAGENWTINNDAKLTIRTDTRVHVGAPGSFTGTLGNVTINKGELFVDGRNIRYIRKRCALCITFSPVNLMEHLLP